LDGSIENHKSHLVSQGLSQNKINDYTNTFVPISKMDTIHIALFHTTSFWWEIPHMDTKSTFLSGDFSQEIFMEQSHCFVSKWILYSFIGWIFVWVEESPHSKV
jgi:hypothetical protein